MHFARNKNADRRNGCEKSHNSIDLILHFPYNVLRYFHRIDRLTLQNNRAVFMLRVYSTGGLDSSAGGRG